MVTRVFTTIRRYMTRNVITAIVGIIALAIVVSLIFFGNRLWQFVRRRAAGRAVEDGRGYSNVDFYEKLLALMEQRGLLRENGQTPLEFADHLKSSEALVITRAYNRVRFGGERLSVTEKREVERALLVLQMDSNE
jgi:hypothetical protein